MELTRTQLLQEIDRREEKVAELRRDWVKEKSEQKRRFIQSHAEMHKNRIEWLKAQL